MTTILITIFITAIFTVILCWLLFQNSSRQKREALNNKISEQINNIELLKVDNKQLQLQNSILIPVNANLVVQKDFNDSHFSIAYEFPLTLHHAIRYQDFSLNSLQNAVINTTDIDTGMVITRLYFILFSANRSNHTTGVDVQSFITVEVLSHFPDYYDPFSCSERHTDRKL